ncbi:hypothetical protein RJT34_28940 [Clitoria ternatea]|uniref:Uncharacterized protein n=1 Tax=Clitoria ternatea TaxID=43366 RepID=A0AAN9FBJ0_CLITE
MSWLLSSRCSFSDLLVEVIEVCFICSLFVWKVYYYLMEVACIFLIQFCSAAIACPSTKPLHACFSFGYHHRWQLVDVNLPSPKPV